MTAQIRPADIADYEEVIKLFGDFVQDQERYLDLNNDSYKEFLNDAKGRMQVAVYDGKISGFITYSLRTVVRYPKPIAEVEEFYVIPEKRRNGIGRALMDKVVEFAKKNNCQYIFIASGKDRSEAHQFYKALNFNEYAFHFRRTP
jgi:GNAT superfamily N-acetyltransferase